MSNFQIVKEYYTKATRGLLATDHVILNHGQVTWTTPELAPPLLTTPPHQRSQLSTDLTCIAALHGGSLVLLKTRREEGFEAQTSTLWCGVEIRRGSGSSDVVLAT
ncbi:hypothetical protein TNCV_2527801 [Trichonephila clavipes]|nr:hypothetical protein TNCV_2527801 [Trichonephila clavipes]